MNLKQTIRIGFLGIVSNECYSASLDVIPSVGKNKILSKKFLRIASTVLSFILFFYSTNTLYSLYSEQKQGFDVTENVLANNSLVEMETKQENLDLPVRLIIPKINVDATVEYVGVNSKGEMAVPSTITSVGWFAFGPPPGWQGNSVIAGHSDGENGEAGVFTNLYKLKEGDTFSIENRRGKTIPFIVRESRTYNPGYVSEVFNASDSAHLNLVTCDGIWNITKKTYNKRLVVFADVIN